MGHLIYLAHPIDFTGEHTDHINNTCAWIKDNLIANGVSAVFTPANAWRCAPPFDPRVQDINERVLAHCDLIVAYLPVGVPSIGVPMEMMIARGNRPLVVIRGTGDYKPEQDSVVLTELTRHAQFYTEDMIPLACQHVATALSMLQELRSLEPDLEDERVVARFDGPGEAPRQAHDDDAGYDLTYHGNTPIVVMPNETVKIPSGISVQMPEGSWAMITGRSSSFKNDLLVPISVIDPGFRGELFAVVRNIGKIPREVHPGDRIAQLIPMPLMSSQIRWESGRLDSSERGDRGFGSTGR